MSTYRTLLLSVCLVALSCGSVQKAAKTFASCSVADLEHDVGDGSLLLTVAKALATADYMAAVDALVTRLGEDAVACASLALDDAASAQQKMGSASTAASTGPTPVQQVIAKHGWRR